MVNFVLINKEELVKIFVCDSMMGTGKSSAAITYMNESVNEKFIYITPYIKEADRIASACRERKFGRPTPKSDGGRLEDLHRMVSLGENIASTHALFARYTPETMDLIRDNGYTLVMDEVFCVMENIKMGLDDVRLLFDAKYVMLDGDRVVWLKPDYKGANFRKLKDLAEQGVLFFYGNKFLFWNFPVEIFTAFKKIYVLTYLFSAQMQRYYFDINGVEYEYIYTAFDGEKYRFSDTPGVRIDGEKIRSLVHVLDDEKMNEIGWDKTALSFTWYENAGRVQMEKVRRNTQNFFKNKCPSRVEDRMWTAYKDYRKYLLSSGGKGSFLSFNIRATNDYKDRFAVAYLVNVHLVPHFKTYFYAHGAKIDENKYALSEMIQWVWRSAIRNDKDIWVYIPSRRMRRMFLKWLDDLAEGKA